MNVLRLTEIRNNQRVECASSRRFEPWLSWELRLLKFIIIIIIIIRGDVSVVAMGQYLAERNSATVGSVCLRSQRFMLASGFIIVL